MTDSVVTGLRVIEVDEIGNPPVPNRSIGNAYGRFLSMANGKAIPIICGHGGSMWLCWECGRNALEWSREHDGWAES